MLIGRQQDRWREMLRGVERGVTIFLASLVPGMHERHVNAVEQRQREEQLLLQQQQPQEDGEAQPPQPEPALQPQLQPQVEDEPEPIENAGVEMW
jgi:hypothetical protein